MKGDTTMEDPEFVKNFGMFLLGGAGLSLALLSLFGENQPNSHRATEFGIGALLIIVSLAIVCSWF
jgi:hypothetical protein